MNWKISHSRRSQRELRRLDGRTAQRISLSLRRLANGESVDVSKMVDHDFKFRMRVGDWRVLFDRDEETRTIQVRRILHRREAYRR